LPAAPGGHRSLADRVAAGIQRLRQSPSGADAPGLHGPLHRAVDPLIVGPRGHEPQDSGHPPRSRGSSVAEEFFCYYGGMLRERRETAKAGGLAFDGGVLRRQMHLRGLNNAALAKRTGLSDATISNALAGRSLHPRTFRAIAAALYEVEL